MNELPQDQAPTKKYIWYADLSLWALALSNLVTIGWAIIYHVPAINIVAIYWAQSVIIGVFNYIRMIKLKNFSTAGFTSNGKPVANDQSGKFETANFFAMHYGFFHVVYLIFIAQHATMEKILGLGYTAHFDWPGVIAISLLFFVNHLFSFIYNYRELTTGGNLGTIMIAPYGRIIPIHLTILLAFFLGPALLAFFLILKAAVDILGHVMKSNNLFKYVDAPKISDFTN